MRGDVSLTLKLVSLWIIILVLMSSLIIGNWLIHEVRESLTYLYITMSSGISVMMPMSYDPEATCST